MAMRSLNELEWKAALIAGGLLGSVYGLTVGSQTQFIGSLCLAAGAAAVVLIEYYNETLFSRNTITDTVGKAEQSE